MGSGTITRDRVVAIGRNKGTPINQNDIGLSTWMDFTTAGVYTFDLGTTDQTGVFGVPRSIFINNLNNPSNLSVSAVGTQFQFDAPANSAGYYKLDSINNSAQLSFATDGGATTPVRIIVYNYDIGPNVWYKFGVFDTTKPIAVYGTLNDGGDIATDSHPAPVKIAGINRATGHIEILSVDATGVLNISGTFALPVGAATAANQVLEIAGLTTINTTLGVPFQTTSPLAAGAAIIGKVGIDQTTPGTTNGVDQIGKSVAHIATSTTTVVKNGVGSLHTLNINSKGVGGTATIYDNNAGSGTILAVIDTTLGLASLVYDVNFAIGLTIVTTGATPADLTVSYR